MSVDILITPRLTLRTMQDSDIPILHEEIFSNQAVVEHTFGKEGFTLEQTQAFLKEQGNFDSKEGLSTLVRGDEVVGIAGVLPCDYLGLEDYEIGFILKQSVWGNGLAKEIGRAQLHYIQKNLGKKRALALVAPQNSASMKSLDSLGFRYVKTIEASRGPRCIYTKAL